MKKGGVYTFRLALLGALFCCGAAAYGLLPSSAELRNGTPVKLKLTETVSSFASHAGDKVNFEIIDEVRFGGEIVIRAGGVARGHIVEARPKHFLRGGSLVIAIDELTLADGETVQLRAYPTQHIDSDGRDISKQIDFSNAHPASLYKPGNAVGSGIEITAYIGADTPLDLARFKHPAPQSAPPPHVPLAQAAPTRVMPQRPATFSPTPSPPADTGQSLDAKTLATIRKLKLKALATDDPAEQVKIYDQILRLNPDDDEAYRRRQDAQKNLDQLKTEEQQRQQQQEQAREKQQEEEAQQHQRQGIEQQALARAKDFFLAGEFGPAAAQIAVAKRIAPADPDVQQLDELIQRQLQHIRHRRYLLVVLGVLGLVSMVTVLFLRRGKKEACLEVVGGEGATRRYRLDHDVTHLGAIAQDGGRKNEIVITDPDHTVSRFHCEIHRRDGKFYVLDCKSANGTFVNNKRVPPGHLQQLRKGSQLKLAEASSLRLVFIKNKV